MNDQSFNPHPCYTDWWRFDSPTVLRRQGRGFLERSWKLDPLQELHALSKSELEILVASYGGQCLSISDHQLLLFDDYHWARRCDAQLIKLGLSTQRWGCHIQLPEQGR
ncbi:hypothetical protein [Methylobacter svalbardensis]|uniref:hypothetical protein n=1 Tax=Methylobacter svalbardensis TaxID=3080016 RepID=UPI0030EF34DD